MGNKSIQEVKDTWEKRLMDIPGVMGIGISLTKDRRERCIKVYANREASVAKIPREIEGYPVEVEVRKPFRALGKKDKKEE
jgi:hypothetical protein